MIRRAGLFLSCGLLGTATVFLAAKNILPTAQVSRIAVDVVLILSALLGIAKLILQDRLVIEIYSGGFVTEVVPSFDGPRLQSGSIEVCQ